MNASQFPFCSASRRLTQTGNRCWKKPRLSSAKTSRAAVSASTTNVLCFIAGLLSSWPRKGWAAFRPRSTLNGVASPGPVGTKAAAVSSGSQTAAWIVCTDSPAQRIRSRRLTALNQSLVRCSRFTTVRAFIPAMSSCKPSATEHYLQRNGPVLAYVLDRRSTAQHKRRCIQRYAMFDAGADLAPDHELKHRKTNVANGC
jgi:hypothetical protein